MVWSLLAELVLALHGVFVLFVVAGGLLACRWPRLAWLHLPAAAWGTLVELTGWLCPLTSLENLLRRRGGEAGYQGACLAHYLEPLLYPSGLTLRWQLLLGGLVVGGNVVVYTLMLRRRTRSGSRKHADSKIPGGTG